MSSISQGIEDAARAAKAHSLVPQTEEEHWRYRARREIQAGLEDAEMQGWVRGVRFGVFITVGFILALGAYVRIGVAIWEMVR